MHRHEVSPYRASFLLDCAGETRHSTPEDILSHIDTTGSADLGHGRPNPLRDGSVNARLAAFHRAVIEGERDIATASMAPEKMVQEISDACDVQDHQKACPLAYAYLQAGHDPEHLLKTLAFAGLRWQNDPHMFTYTRSSIEEYRANTTDRRREIILALARYVSGCVKRAATFECYEMYQRYFVN